MLKLIDLATRPDFRAGPLLVSPSRRLIEGPAGQTTVEPLVMKVFLLLLDAGGRVVTRNELFAACWGGVMVGDDSLNRAIGRVRRIAADTGPGSFEVTVIPRTGYQLTGEAAAPETGRGGAEAGFTHAVSRRALVGSAAAASILAASGAGLWFAHERRQQQFDDLVDRGRQALDYGHPLSNPAPFLAKAVELRPGDAAAQGLLALAEARNAENGDPAQATNAVAASAKAARGALAIDPNEPNARAALVELRSAELDLITTETQLLQILKADPRDTYPMPMLWGLYQSTGRSRDAFALIERAITLKPLAAAYNYPRAQLLWILGRTAEADRVIDQAIQFWPEHPFVRFARFIILAYTGRAPSALTMLNNDQTRPQSFDPAVTGLWRAVLPALADPTPSKVASARDACVEGGRTDSKLAYHGMMMLSALGQIDDAFSVANDFLLFRNPVAPTIAAAPPVRSTSWRFTPGLFTPPAAAMRADPRFKMLCDGIGLTDYWHKRGVRPDYQLG